MLRKPRRSSRDIQDWNVIESCVRTLARIYENAVSLQTNIPVYVFNRKASLRAQKSWKPFLRLHARLHAHQIDPTDYIWSVLQKRTPPAGLKTVPVNWIASEKCLESYQRFQEENWKQRFGTEPARREAKWIFFSDKFLTEVRRQAVEGARHLIAYTSSQKASRLFRETSEGLGLSPYYAWCSSTHRLLWKWGLLDKDYPHLTEGLAKIRFHDSGVFHVVLDGIHQEVERLWSESAVPEAFPADEQWLESIFDEREVRMLKPWLQSLLDRSAKKCV